MPHLQAVSDSEEDIWSDSESSIGGYSGEGDDGAMLFSDVEDSGEDLEGSEVDWSEVQSFTISQAGSDGVVSLDSESSSEQVAQA